MKRRALPAFLVAAGLVLATHPLVALGPESEEGSVSISTEKTGTAGLASIEVHSSVAGSTVSINRVDAAYNAFSAGTVPPGGEYTAGVGATGVTYTIYQNDSLPPGSYIIGVSAPGYYRHELSLILDEKTKYYLYFSLSMISGTLDVEVSPADATLLIDDHPVSAGSLTLPVGQHGLTLRRFGYLERRLSVLVREKETTSLTLSLDPAPFSVSALRVSREAFNPANAGFFGRIDLRFRVEAFGSATLVISDEQGKAVATQDFPSFDTWDQRYTWEGRDAEGKPLSDGSYTARLEARAADVASGGASGGANQAGGQALVREARLRIDSSLVLRPRGSLSAIPGLAYFPDPRGEPAGSGSAELTWLSPASNFLRPSFALSAAAALLPELDLAFGAAAEDLSSASGGADLALSLRYGLWSQGPTRGSAGALFLRGSWSDASSALLADSASGIELSLPLAVVLGPLELGASPGLRLDLSASEAGFEALTRAAVWTAAPLYRAGLSAELAYSLGKGGIAPRWPLEAGIDLRALMAPSPLELSLLAQASYSPSTATQYRLGMALGLLF